MREVINILRRYLSKSFFIALMAVASTKKQSHIAIRFRAERVGENLVEAQTISQYIQELYASNAPRMAQVASQGRARVTLVASQQVIWKALKKLSQNKASGLDLLPDYFLKDQKVSKSILTKLTLTFNLWLSGTPLPDYLRVGRIFCLSKERTEYPSVGGIRTIAILPTTTKLYELSLL